MVLALPWMNAKLTWTMGSSTFQYKTLIAFGAVGAKNSIPVTRPSDIRE
jgi:hypothetical protein